MNLLEDLELRGLVKDITHKDELSSHLMNNKISLYCGFDPTADSLHVGSLLPLVTLLRFKNEGHSPLALIGGATGLIGDPSGKHSERVLNSDQTVIEFSKCIENQIKYITSIKCIDNNEWTSSMSVIDFLRDVGKHFSVNSMIGKESVKQRINRDDQGISFTEFSYMLLQSMDFMFLNKNMNCALQIGGSDQWGNITSGIDLIRKSGGKDNVAFGLTIPLITKSDGTKFGKSESGNIWLDSSKTSPFNFFQFWLRTDDSDVIKFLKFFTFLTLEEISDIEMSDRMAGGRPKAQEVLAENLTKMVHGSDGLNSAKRITDAMFTSDFSGLSEKDFAQLSLDGINSINIDNSGLLIDNLILSNLASSKRQAREFISNGAISVNGEKINEFDFILNKTNSFFGKWFIMKRGKRNVALVKL